MKESHVALLGVKSFSNDGITLMKNVFRSLSKICEIRKVSSVYQIEGEIRSPSHLHDLRRVSSFTGLSVVAKLETEKDPPALQKAITQIQAEHESLVENKSVSLNLLIYENVTVMTEDLTIPYPGLHQKPELLFPAVEIWGEFVHPVLGQSLHTLTKTFANLQWGEFHSQGKSLLDFSQS